MKISEKEAYDDIHQQLVRELQNAYIDETGKEDDASPDIDLSFLKESAAAGKKRRKLYLRAAGIAAAVLVVLLGANIMLLASDKGDTYGDKGVLHRLYDNIYGLFTDEDDAGMDDAEDSIRITDRQDMDKAKRFLPELYVPQYIPDGYELDYLSIDRYRSGDAVCDYSYSNDEGAVLAIMEAYASGNDFEYLSQGDGEFIQKDDRTMYLVWDDVFEEYTLTVYTEACSIDIYIAGNKDKDTLIRIGEGLTK